MGRRVRLVTKDVQNALVLPEQALVPQGEEQYVFKVVDGKAVRQKVEVGQRRDGKAEIVQGVALDDVVVTAGQLKLRDGMPVNVAGAPVNAASAETPSAPGKAPKSDAVFAPTKNGNAPGQPRS